MSDSHLTIGKVVKRLQAHYPDLTISKVRYLEDEGLLAPSRTASGYRLYSAEDVARLENILHLQKTRFMPLSVIREQLDGAPKSESSDSEVVGAEQIILPAEAEGILDQLHPIDRAPELLGTTVSFIHQLAEVGVIELKRSPHGRDLIEGADFPLIRLCDELRHFGIEPRNLRQYVTAANRESSMMEQALVVFARKGSSGVHLDAEGRKRFDAGLSRILGLTNTVRAELIARRVTRPSPAETPNSKDLS